MKITGIIVYLFAFVAQVFLPGGVDFSDKKIGKEISKELEINDFRVEEIKSIQNIASNGEILGKYFHVISGSDTLSYLYAGRVFTCPSGGCEANINSSLTTEYFDYMVLYSREMVISRVTVLNYQATHGQEVCARGWLKQFIGFSGSEELRVGKNIDALSGATRSALSIVEDITLQTRTLINNIHAPESAS